MRYCIFCGRKVPGDAKYCQICGKEQPEDTMTTEEEVPKEITSKQMLLWGVGGFVILLLILTGVMVFLLGS